MWPKPFIHTQLHSAAYSDEGCVCVCECEREREGERARERGYVWLYELSMVVGSIPTSSSSLPAPSAGPLPPVDHLSAVHWCSALSFLQPGSFTLIKYSCLGHEILLYSTPSPLSRKLSFILSTAFSLHSNQFKSHFYLCIHLSLCLCLQHICWNKVLCSGPHCSLLVPVRTHVVTSWRLALMHQTSLSCVLLLKLPHCPLWTQISWSVITALFVSVSSVMPALLFTASCLDPGQVSEVSSASCIKEHYIL